MKRDFNSIIDNLVESISTYDYFVDFNKVFNNVEDIEYKLNNLNYLLGKEDFDNEFRKTFQRNPEVVTVLPILLAIRRNNIAIIDEDIINYDFVNYMSVDDYLKFIYETRLIELFYDKRIRNLIDYVTGVEVGLDSNARKNRIGKQMEFIVENYIKEIPNIKYLKQATLQHVKEEFNINVNLNTSEVPQNKRYDFIVKDQSNKIYLIETNYYSSGGSKLNEVARSYTKIDNDIKNVSNAEFIWITDGVGWNTTKVDLHQAYTSMKHLYTIYDLNNNILNKIFNK